jgi:transposase
MNQRKKPSYTDEFKAEAVALIIQQGGHIPEVAKNLGISESALRCWVAKEETSGIPATSLGPLEKELRDLKQKLQQTEQERDILKKALGYFANPLK